MIRETNSESSDMGLNIYFQIPDMGLREVGLVSTSLHRIVNKIAEYHSDIWYDGPRGWHDGPRGPFYDPLAISLVITDISYGSFSAKTKLVIGRTARNLGIGITSSLLANIIWSLAYSAPQNVAVKYLPPPPEAHPVDVGGNIRSMAYRLSRTGKPWELIVETSGTNGKVIIRSK